MRAVNVIAISLVIIAAFSWYLVYEKNMEITGMAVYDSPQISTEDYLESEIRLEGNSISLISGCRKLVMITTEEQIISIRNGARDRIDFRPTTHDLMDDVFENYGIEVLKVKIESMQSGAYFANLLLKQDDRFFVVDSRPSDAIGIAVRSGAPVFVSKMVMEEYGEDIC